ncbi:MAG: hypothetical protein PHAS_01701 [Phascolarctobacterium sp.]
MIFFSSESEKVEIFSRFSELAKLEALSRNSESEKVEIFSRNSESEKVEIFSRFSESETHLYILRIYIRQFSLTVKGEKIVVGVEAPRPTFPLPLTKAKLLQKMTL